MRMTKKLLREAKNGFKKRCKELCLMPEEKFQAEFERCFPNEKFTGTHGELLNYMLVDLLDLSFPTAWHEG